MADFAYPVTCLMPYLQSGDSDRKKWLREALKSLPKGMPYLVAANAGKSDMALALNMALEQVETDFIWLQGSDDRCGRGTIDKLYSAIGTADIAYPSMRLMRAGGSTIGRHLADVFSVHRLQDENLCGVFLARTQALRDVGGWHDQLIEDWDLVKRLADNGARFVAVPDATYQYRIHRKSLSHRIQVEADKQDVDPIQQSPGLDERKPMLATFYCGTGAQVSYVRSQIPAKHLPGVARRTFDLTNRHQTPAAIFEHWYDRETWDKAAKQGRARLIDVDDQYLSNYLQRDMRRMTGTESAGGWEDSQRVHRQLAREADAIICSTIPLAYKYAEVNQNVHVIPNLVDPDDWSEIHPLRWQDDVVRVCWPAGKQHWPDAALIEPAMRWAAAQPHVEVSTIGIDPGWDFAYHYEPFTPSPQTYRDILSMMDVVVAPVRPNDMTRAKSDIKWLEAAMCGAPLIASRVEAYQTITHGENGFLARGQRDFLKYMKLLVGSQDERLRVGKNATERVLATRDASRVSQLPYMQVLASCGVGTIEQEVAACA